MAAEGVIESRVTRGVEMRLLIPPPQKTRQNRFEGVEMILL